MFTVDPFKYELYSSTERWLWDPFRFEGGIAREYFEMKFDGDETITIPAGSVSGNIAISTVEIDENFRVSYKDKAYALGLYLLSPLVLDVPDDEDVVLTFGGAGKVSILFRGGKL